MNRWRITRYLIPFVFLGWLYFAFRISLPRLTRPAFTEIDHLVSQFIANAGILDLLLILWFFSVAYAIGAKVLSFFRFSFDSDAEAVAFCSSVGCAVLSFLTLVLGLVHLLYSSVVYGSLIILTLWFRREVRWPLRLARAGITRVAQSWGLSPRGLAYFFVHAYLATLLVIALIAALGPEIEFDALNYHLLGPKIYTEQHRLVSIPDNPHTFLPKNVEMLFALGMLLRSEITAKLVHLLFGLLLSLTIYAAARRFFSREAGLVAAAMLFSSPIVLWEMKTAHVDVALAHYVFLSLYAFLLFVTSDHRAWLRLSALTAGFSAGIKYHGFFAIAALAFLVFVHWLTARHESLLKALRAALKFGFLSLLLFLPWAVITGSQTGDPVFPILTRFLPSPYWTRQEAIIVLGTIGGESYLVSLSDWQTRVATLWGVFTHQQGRFDGYIGPFYLIFLPLLALVPKQRNLTSPILVFAVVYTLGWLVTIQFVRFLIPLLACLSLILPPLFLHLLGNGTGFQRVLSRLCIYLICFAAILNLPFFERYGSGARYGNSLLDTMPLKLLTGLEDRDEYLTRWLQSYPVVQYCNGLSDVKKVLFWWSGSGDPYPAYYVKSASAFILAPFVSRLSGAEPDEARKVLIENSVTHLVAYQENQRADPITDPEREFVKKYLKRLHQKNGVILYQVVRGEKAADEEQLVFSFVDHLEEAKAMIDGRREIDDITRYRAVFGFDGDPRYSVIAPAPSQVEFSLRAPEHALLKFSLAKAFPDCGDGGRGAVLIVDEKDQTHDVYSRDINPRDNGHDRGWFHEEVNLSTFAGQKVRIIFKTDGGQADQMCDWFLWADAGLYARSTQAK